MPGVRSGSRPQFQPASHPQVQVGRGDLVDRYLVGAIRLRLAPGEHLRDLQQMAEPAIRRRKEHAVCAQPAGSYRRRLKPDYRGDRRHVRETRQRVVITAESAACRRDEHVGRLRLLQEPGIRAIGPQRSRRSREHRPARQADEQYQEHPTPPPGPELVRGKAQDGPHTSTVGAARSAREGARRTRPGVPSTTGFAVPAHWRPAPACETTGTWITTPWRLAVLSMCSSRTTT